MTQIAIGVLDGQIQHATDPKVLATVEFVLVLAAYYRHTPGQGLRTLPISRV